MPGGRGECASFEGFISIIVLLHEKMAIKPHFSSESEFFQIQKPATTNRAITTQGRHLRSVDFSGGGSLSHLPDPSDSYGTREALSPMSGASPPPGCLSRKASMWEGITMIKLPFHLPEIPCPYTTGKLYHEISYLSPNCKKKILLLFSSRRRPSIAAQGYLSSRSGRRIATVKPPPSALFQAAISPPWLSTAVFASAKPKPKPPVSRARDSSVR